MSTANSHYGLLERYLSCEFESDWALATLVTKAGSSYRSPGAFMFISPLAQCFGLVSGGCLEADVIRRSRMVLHEGKAQYVIYDMREEDSYAAELGIGCDGRIGILIQQLTPAHRELLALLYRRLQQGSSSVLSQVFEAVCDQSQLNQLSLLDIDGSVLFHTGSDNTLPKPSQLKACSSHSVFNINGAQLSVSTISPPLNLWVFGGGADARPLVKMAAALGWRVSVVDHRGAYAKLVDFSEAENIYRQRPEEIAQLPELKLADAAVFMTHNLDLDANWLLALHEYHWPSYVGLLGPMERKYRVLAKTGLNASSIQDAKIHGPVGLNLGGELPESIALAILAECHAKIYQGNGAKLDLNTN